ncbi:MAG: membrane protein of unknown function [Deltaproteobacteria bacterium]|nr:membrane protein of unknown function [Deltaproteobacteria bacterium]
MDVVAHGLWGGALFFPRGGKKFLAGFVVGMAPDLLSFGAFHVTRPGWIVGRLAGEISGPPPFALLPDYVFYAYNVTHSLIVWAMAFFLLWWFMKGPPWLMFAWALHILCDIPTHGRSYFPTPFLWPLPTPFVDGITWATPEFLAGNYLCLVLVYGGLFAYQRRRIGLLEATKGNSLV